MVKFLNREPETDEEKEIIDDAREAMKNHWEWKRLEDKRYYTQEALQRAVKLDYPLITGVDITHDRISIETEKHYYSKGRYDNADKPTEPRFKCDMKASEMPDTAEEFMEMKRYINEDKQQVEDAMSFLLTKFNVQEA